MTMRTRTNQAMICKFISDTNDGKTEEEVAADVVDEDQAEQTLKDWNFIIGDNGRSDDLSRTTCDWYHSPGMSSVLIEEEKNGYQNIMIPYRERPSRPMIIMSHLCDLNTMKYIAKRHNEMLLQQQKVVAMPSKDTANDNTLSHNVTASTKQRKQQGVKLVEMTDGCGLFPLYTAISQPHCEEEVLKVVKWLVQSQNANVHQSIRNNCQYTAFTRACYKGYGRVAEWLAVEGNAFLDCEHVVEENDHENDDDGTEKASLSSSSSKSSSSSFSFQHDLAKRQIQPSKLAYATSGCTWKDACTAQGIHEGLFYWAESVIATRRTFLTTVLTGTMISNSIDDDVVVQHKEEEEKKLMEELQQQKEQRRVLSNCLQLLNGHTGLIELIAAYVGVERRKTVLTTARGLVQHQDWYNNKIFSV